MSYKFSGRYIKLYQPQATAPFKLSRSKLELFLECPRCFYLDRRLGIARPGFPAFTLNIAVDALLKKEFDIHRAKGKPHPLMQHYGIDAVPLAHEQLNAWRENFTGVRFHHQPTNLIITGAPDDVWVNPKGEYHVVDYKATSTTQEITLDSEYRQGYKRQMEVYQWLLRQNGSPVSDLGYFVYVNGRTDAKAFDGKLEFDAQIIPYTGSDRWVEPAITAAHACLQLPRAPQSSVHCGYCAYTLAVARLT